MPPPPAQRLEPHARLDVPQCRREHGFAIRLGVSRDVRRRGRAGREHGQPPHFVVGVLRGRARQPAVHHLRIAQCPSASRRARARLCAGCTPVSPRRRRAARAQSADSGATFPFTRVSASSPARRALDSRRPPAAPRGRAGRTTCALDVTAAVRTPAPAPRARTPPARACRCVRAPPRTPPVGRRGRAERRGQRVDGLAGEDARSWPWR